MKKILQRIGLLAVAVMLLWGWQGMEAKAADNIFTFECDYSSPIDKTKLKVVQEGNNYHFDIYPADGYAFTQAPTASLVDYIADTSQDFTVKKGSDDTYYRCSIDNVSLDSNHKYSISIIVNGEIEITKIRIMPTAPVIGQVLPSKWDFNTTDVREEPLVWMSDGRYVTDSVAEPNKTYFANITLSAASGYKFSDNVAIAPNSVEKHKNSDGSITFAYEFKTGDAQPSNPGNTNSEITSDSWEKKKETNAPASNDDSSEEPYKIINGAKGTWNGSTTEGLIIRGDGDFAKFAGVRVDGNWIPSAHYEAKSGSTIVTLKPSYLASLAEGEHTVDIMWIDDSASTTFTVAANTAAAQPELDSVPKTGEGVMGWMPEILLLVAAGLTIMGALRLKKAK